jgi:hypothetical protein
MALSDADRRRARALAESAPEVTDTQKAGLRALLTGSVPIQDKPVTAAAATTTTGDADAAA